MKKNLLLLILLSVIFSCSDQTKELLTNDGTEELEKILTRAFVNKTQPSTSNPLLLTQWESLREVVLNSGSRVSLPWTEGSPSILNFDFSTDIKKENGWVMLFHTFQEVGLDSGQNYMFFYNELRGMVKVFYHREGKVNSKNGFMWHIEQNSPSVSLFNSIGYFSQAAPERNTSYAQFTNASMNPVDGLVGEAWNGFEFEVPYTVDKIAGYSISAFSNSILEYTFEGKTESTISGTIMRAKEKESKLGIPKALANLAGGGAKKFIDAAVNMTGLSQKIKDAISSASKDNYGSAIQAGVKYISGSILGWQEEYSTDYVNLTSTGTISLSGTSSESLVGQVVPVTTYNNSLFDCYGGYLGVWDLSVAPSVIYERYTPFINPELESHYSYNAGYIKDGKVASPKVRVSSVNVVTNPLLNEYITSKKITTELFCYQKVDGVNYPVDKLTANLNTNYYDWILTDLNLSLLKWKSSTPGNYFKATGTVAKGYNFYDWGEPEKMFLHCVVNVIVELEFDYKGKKHTYISSRNYDAKINHDNYNINQPNYYVVKDAYVSGVY